MQPMLGTTIWRRGLPIDRTFQTNHVKDFLFKVAYQAAPGQTALERHGGVIEETDCSGILRPRPGQQDTFDAITNRLEADSHQKVGMPSAAACSMFTL
eukprot:331733-Chlamydomonas_euryale.AAC.12